MVKTARAGEILREERGFTLAEVMVAMTMMVVVLFALHAVFDATVRIFDLGGDRLEAVESARLGLEKMQREIRAAYPYDAASGYDHLLWTAGATTTGAIPPPDRITFGNDLNGSGKVDCPPSPAPASACEVITYGVYRPSGGSTYALGRARSRGGSLQAVVGNVADVDGDGEALSFEYLDAAGSPAASEPQVSAVRIELEIEVEGRGQTLATKVYLRNRGARG
ncbi:MAG TPA: prepilin-type N-terminal cleavage/methylation domain-containing protein [Rubrobacteraceae bacterium]|nr:prepilin-type N-terminal cleavage/methylation domain-containing protein [Rubrobacteraceae bacterium]